MKLFSLSNSQIVNLTVFQLKDYEKITIQKSSGLVCYELHLFHFENHLLLYFYFYKFFLHYFLHLRNLLIYLPNYQNHLFLSFLVILLFFFSGIFFSLIKILSSLISFILIFYTFSSILFNSSLFSLFLLSDNNYSLIKFLFIFSFFPSGISSSFVSIFILFPIFLLSSFSSIFFLLLS